MTRDDLSLISWHVTVSESMAHDDLSLKAWLALDQDAAALNCDLWVGSFSLLRICVVSKL